MLNSARQQHSHTRPITSIQINNFCSDVTKIWLKYCCFQFLFLIVCIYLIFFFLLKLYFCTFDELVVATLIGYSNSAVKTAIKMILGIGCITNASSIVDSQYSISYFVIHMIHLNILFCLLFENRQSI